MQRDPKRRRLVPPNAPFRSPLSRPSNPASTSSPLSGRRPFKSPILSRNDREGLTPELIALLNRKRTLELELKEEKRRLETAETALKYEQKVYP